MQIFRHPHPPRKSRRPSQQRRGDSGADPISEPKSALSSILGVAFDDYIGEEGVLHPPRATAMARGGGGGQWLNGDGGAGTRAAHSSSEEDKR